MASAPVASGPADAAPVDPARIADYHMHVYYDPESRPRAAQLREWVETRFPVRMGRWHDVPVGPHPTAMYQIHFAPDQFSTLVPFVMMNRMGLTVLLHPESGRPRDDHTLNATWMGEVLPLNTVILPETDRHT
jgi:aromatic ring-cleaving dioxygenase